MEVSPPAVLMIMRAVPPSKSIHRNSAALPWKSFSKVFEYCTLCVEKNFRRGKPCECFFMRKRQRCVCLLKGSMSILCPLTCLWCRRSAAVTRAKNKGNVTHGGWSDSHEHEIHDKWPSELAQEAEVGDESPDLSQKTRNSLKKIPLSFWSAWCRSGEAAALRTWNLLRIEPQSRKRVAGETMFKALRICKNATLLSKNIHGKKIWQPEEPCRMVWEHARMSTCNRGFDLLSLLCTLWTKHAWSFCGHSVRFESFYVESFMQNGCKQGTWKAWQ